MSTTKKRVIQGKVVKKSGDKSFSVLVERKVLHPRYHKIVRRFKKYMIHDEENTLNPGDVVQAIENQPVSSKKRFKLLKVVSKGVIA